MERKGVMADIRVYKTAVEYVNEFSNASSDLLESMRT